MEHILKNRDNEDNDSEIYSIVSHIHSSIEDINNNNERNHNFSIIVGCMKKLVKINTNIETIYEVRNILSLVSKLSNNQKHSIHRICNTYFNDERVKYIQLLNDHIINNEYNQNIFGDILFVLKKLYYQAHCYDNFNKEVCDFYYKFYPNFCENVKSSSILTYKQKRQILWC